MLWSRSFEQRPPKLVRLDPGSVYLFWPDTAVIERIDTVSGETRWRSEPFASLFQPDAEFDARVERAARGFDAPIDGRVSPQDLLVSFGRAEFVLTERSGRIAAFDQDTGGVLWTLVTPIHEVYDTVVAGASVALAGTIGPGDNEPIGAPGVLTLHVRTGLIERMLDDLSGSPRWVREAEGMLLIGLDAEVVSINPVSGDLRWTSTGAGTFESVDAWVVGTNVYLLGNERDLWLISAADGELSDDPLDTGSHLHGEQPIALSRIGDRAAFTSDRGVVVFDASGRLLGRDAVGPGADLVRPAPAQGRFVSVDRVGTRAADGRPGYWYFVFDGTTCRLLERRLLTGIWERPEALALLDDRIVLTAGGNTLVFSAPSGE